MSVPERDKAGVKESAERLVRLAATYSSEPPHDDPQPETTALAQAYLEQHEALEAALAWLEACSAESTTADFKWPDYPEQQIREVLQRA